VRRMKFSRGRSVRWAQFSSSKGRLASCLCTCPTSGPFFSVRWARRAPAHAQAAVRPVPHLPARAGAALPAPGPSATQPARARPGPALPAVSLGQGGPLGVWAGCGSPAGHWATGHPGSPGPSAGPRTTSGSRRGCDCDCAALRCAGPGRGRLELRLADPASPVARDLQTSGGA
jgi:hypothetical protein